MSDQKTITAYEGVKEAAKRLYEGQRTGEWCKEYGTHIENQIEFIEGFIKEAYVAGFQRGVKEGNTENVF